MITRVLNPTDGAKRDKGTMPVTRGCTQIKKATERVALKCANSALDQPAPEKN